MKGMMSRLLVALALVLSTPAWAFDFFGLFGSDDEADLESLLSSIPADTALFAGVRSHPESADFLDGWTSPAAAGDLEELNQLLSEGEVETPALAIIGWLLEDYNQAASEGQAALNKRYGLANDAVGVFYLHGVMPVARFTLADPEAFEATFARAAEETGQAPRRSEVADLSVRHWRFADENDPLGLELAVATDGNIGTVTVISGADDEARRAQRFGQAEVADSLADSGGWQALGEAYDFDDYSRGYFSLVKLAEGLLQPDSNSLGQDLRRLAPQMMDDLQTNLEASCRQEWIELAGQAPRLVFGSESTEVTAEFAHQQARLIWELNNTDLVAELGRLPGSVPAYAGDGSDKLFALALGLDVDALAPVATALWRQFTSASFDCTQLVALQNRARSLNPGMLGMVSGMAQGLKGAGLALYNLEGDDASPLGLTGSALLSLSATDPVVLARTLTSSVPPLSNLEIPASGEPVQLPLPLPQPVHAAIRGSHLVAYTGAAAGQAADALAEEPLNQDGLVALALNYEQLGEAVLTALETPGVDPAGMMGGAQGMALDCATTYADFLALSQLPLTLTYGDTFTERGWEGRVSARIGQLEPTAEIEPGRYQLAYLNANCDWEDGGRDNLDADGGGDYSERDATDSCEIYRNSYQWRQDGARLILEGSEAQRRDSCEAAWAEAEPESFECTLVGARGDAHYCLYEFDDSTSLMRYQQR